MGHSEAEAGLTFTAMKSEHGNGIMEDLIALSAANSVEQNHFKLEKKSSPSSSSSSSSSSGDFEFELVSTDCSRLLSGEDAAPNSDSFENGITVRLLSAEDAARNPDNNKNGVPVSSMPNQEKNPSKESSTPTQSPPKQVMERPASGYRIPSSIFSKNNQADWSVASNESLFSIHTGNMSFRGDNAGWLGMSGELGLQGDPRLSHIDYTSNQPPSVQAQANKSTELARNNNPVVGATESKAAETMREVIRENEADASKDSLHTKISLNSASFRGSDASGASVKSFAFPILTGGHKDSQKSHALSPTLSQPSSQPQKPKAGTEKETEKEAETQPQPPMGEPGIVSRWLSCAACRSCCS